MRNRDKDLLLFDLVFQGLLLYEYKESLLPKSYFGQMVIEN